jgi:hypothetical protein
LANTKAIVSAAFPIVGLIWSIVENSSKETEAASHGTKDEFHAEVAKQTVRLQLAKLQAQVAQEMAIASRIETAEEVEIEEFYETSGKGHAGASFDQKAGTVSIGAGAEGLRVTKRIYHFKGGPTIKRDVD